MGRLYLSLLGGFEAHAEDIGAPLRFPTRKSEALLTYLAVQPDIRNRRDHLSSLLWGDVSHTQARHSLRQTLSAIRGVLKPVDCDVLSIADDTVGVESARLRVDVRTFERLARRRTPRSVAIASHLYRGEFLKGLSIRELEFDAWLMMERTRLHQIAIEAHETCLTAHMAAHHTTEAIQVGLRLLALDPLQEWVHRALMELYAERGQFGAALHQFELCVTTLARELRVAPSPETVELWRQIMVNRSSASAAPRPTCDPNSPGSTDHDALAHGTAGREPRRATLRRELWHQRKPRGE